MLSELPADGRLQGPRACVGIFLWIPAMPRLRSAGRRPCHNTGCDEMRELLFLGRPPGPSQVSSPGTGKPYMLLTLVTCSDLHTQPHVQDPRALPSRGRERPVRHDDLAICSMGRALLPLWSQAQLSSSVIHEAAEWLCFCPW